jgi:hypothetical protein
VVDPAVLTGNRSAVMLDALQHCLRGHFDVSHSTFQLEPAGHADHESVCVQTPAGRGLALEQPDTSQ